MQGIRPLRGMKLQEKEEKDRWKLFRKRLKKKGQSPKN